jgi:YTH domain-containing protein 1
MESLPGSVEIPQWQRGIAWESAGAFKVKWLVINAIHFQRVGHLKNPLNENSAGMTTIPLLPTSLLLLPTTIFKMPLQTTSRNLYLPEAVLIGKDGQEIEENCGSRLIELLDEEVEHALHGERFSSGGRKLKDKYSYSTDW